MESAMVPGKEGELLATNGHDSTSTQDTTIEFWAFADSKVPLGKGPIPLGEGFNKSCSRRRPLNSFRPAKEPLLREGGVPLGGYVLRDSVGSQHRRSHRSSHYEWGPLLCRESWTRLTVEKPPSPRAVDLAHDREAAFIESRGHSSP
jgi:hypothetical protein